MDVEAWHLAQSPVLKGVSVLSPIPSKRDPRQTTFKDLWVPGNSAASQMTWENLGLLWSL